MSNRFTNGLPKVATIEDCEASWSGGKNGKYFRCGFCGYKFKAGDTYRWQYTNDIKGAPGNPLICEQCDKGSEKTREKKCKEFYSEKWWWFRRTNGDYR